MEDGKIHIIEQGECLSSMAYANGFFPDTIWKHGKNAALKEQRKDPNVLLPGDQLYVPDKRCKEVSCSSDARHRFRRKGVPNKLRVRLLDCDEPIANARYTLEVDGRCSKGKTNGEGVVEAAIQPGARRARLVIPERKLEYFFNLGHLDPADTVTGAQARLNNLGHHAGPVDGVLGPRTAAALRAFQRKHNVPVTGKLDGDTIRRLIKVHGN